jgi:hypothetical protein
MKCIKSIRQTKEVELGEIKRVDDKMANNMVGSYWKYVSKSEWKQSIGKKVVEETTDQVDKKPNPKQMDGIKSDAPFVKTRKNKNENK